MTGYIFIKKNNSLRNSTILFLAGLLALHPYIVLGAATSTNFIITSDSINCGGTRSSSTNFILNNSLCETTQGSTTSTNFVSEGGFQVLKDIPFISVTLSTTSLSLGTLTTSAVTTAAITTTVTTNAESGYTSTIIENANITNGAGGTIGDVSDGTVSAGSSEYGFSTSGTDGQYNSTDTSITSSPKTYATRSSTASAVATIVTLKTAISSATPTGTYGNTITFITTGTF